MKKYSIRHMCQVLHTLSTGVHSALELMRSNICHMRRGTGKFLNGDRMFPAIGGINLAQKWGMATGKDWLYSKTVQEFEAGWNWVGESQCGLVFPF